jgi:hypothetical protein
MELLKEQLIHSAREKFSTILPYNNSETLHEGFSVVGNVLMFWFDTVDNSSHLLSKKL